MLTTGNQDAGLAMETMKATTTNKRDVCMANPVCDSLIRESLILENGFVKWQNSQPALDQKQS